MTVTRIEHAAMVLEWLRRNMPHWDDMLRTYPFTEVAITEVEKGKDVAQASGTLRAAGDLGIGSFRRPPVRLHPAHRPAAALLGPRWRRRPAWPPPASSSG